MGEIVDLIYPEAGGILEEGGEARGATEAGPGYSTVPFPGAGQTGDVPQASNRASPVGDTTVFDTPDQILRQLRAGEKLLHA